MLAEAILEVASNAAVVIPVENDATDVTKLAIDALPIANCPLLMLVVVTLVEANNVPVVMPNENLPVPFTSNVELGLVVPIPTFPVV